MNWIKEILFALICKNILIGAIFELIIGVVLIIIAKLLPW